MVRSSAVSGPWVLVLGQPASDPRRRLGGLSLALRLARDAQRAGARTVVCTESSGLGPGDLADVRLRIPVVESAPPDAPRITVAASIVAHRATLAARADRDTDGVVEPGAAPPEG